MNEFWLFRVTSEFIRIWTLSLNTNASAHSSVGSVGRGGAGHMLCSAALSSQGFPLHHGTWKPVVNPHTGIWMEEMKLAIQAFLFILTL